MRPTLVVVLTLGLSGNAWAQADWTPPPMVPAPETPMPGTPPPPTLTPSPYAPTPSPYGQQTLEKPAPEVGLMVSESLFGMLTAAGVSLLPYFLLEASGLLTDNTIGSILLVSIFGAVPLATAQTQISIANGSRYYFSETWPGALSGLAAQAAVLGLFYATGWLPKGTAAGGGTGGPNSGAPTASGSIPLLLIGSGLIVPLIQMAVINLTKTPKFRTPLDPKAPVKMSPPTASPIVMQTSRGTSLGFALNLLNGSF